MAQVKASFLDKVLSRIERLDRSALEAYVTGLVREHQETGEVLDQINEGVLILDREGKVQYANQRAYALFGFERFYKNRSLVTDLVNEPFVKDFLMERLQSPEEASAEEFQVLSPRELVLRIDWIPLEVEGEKEILLRIENITSERARLEEEAQTQRIESLIRLAAGVAHEIGNPLNAIQIHITLLKREIAKFPKEKQKGFNKYLEILSSETRRLDQIVRSFLRAARRPPLRFRMESINALIEEALDFMQPEMRKCKVQSRLLLDKKLPGFLMDRDRLHQAFINLIKNALEAMPEGGELKVSSHLKEKICLLRFEDKGTGIEEKDLPHIFESYYTTKVEGSGLGLAQVYQAIREHGGRIDVKSRPGKGSTFLLALPVRTERLSLPGPHVNTRNL